VDKACLIKYADGSKIAVGLLLNDFEKAFDEKDISILPYFEEKVDSCNFIYDKNDNKFYELLTTYKKDNVYKAITTLNGQYYTFFFKDITSNSMYATYVIGPYTTQSSAENATPGSYIYYYKQWNKIIKNKKIHVEVGQKLRWLFIIRSNICYFVTMYKKKEDPSELVFQ